MNVQKYIELLNSSDSPANPENDTFPQYDEVLGRLHGMSRPRNMAMLNEAVWMLDENEIYLEVGTYQGCSLIGALLGNPMHAVAVDNFSQFRQTNNEEILMNHLDLFGVKNRVKFYNKGYVDFFLHDAELIELDGNKVGVYYYDGAHDTDSQLIGYEMALQFLAHECLIFVDDYRYPEVRESIRLFQLAHPEFETIFERIPDNNFDQDWWNGICVLARQVGYGQPVEVSKELIPKEVSVE